MIRMARSTRAVVSAHIPLRFLLLRQRQTA